MGTLVNVLGWLIIALTLISLVCFIVHPYSRIRSRAKRRAAALLHDVLTPEQRHQLVWQGYVEIPSPTEPQRVYCVPRTKGLVQVRENGCLRMRLCLQPVESLPDADIVALHKLMIEADEETYLQKANKL